MPIVTAFYAALTALFGVFLAIRVIRLRQNKHISLGDGDDPEMSRRVRIFGNFAEYAALILVLLGLAELTGLSRIWLHVYGTAFVLGRVVHAFGLSRARTVNAGRTVGMVLTFATMIGLSISLLVTAVPKL